MKTFTVSEPFLDLQCGLAEGPYWERQTNVLRFVDILKNAVYRVDLSLGPSSLRKQEYEVSMGTTADIVSSNNSFAFGGKHGIGIAKNDSSEYRYIQKFWSNAEVEAGLEYRMRANDGAVDSQGRYWVSTLNDPLVTGPAPVGVLFRLDSDGTFHRMIEQATIPNGLSWSADDKIMYFTDSDAKKIFQYDFEPATGFISNRRVFFNVQDEIGVPDGHAQDVDGNLWVAVWGAGKVVRVSKEGEVTARIDLPTRCITSVVFIDEDLYITSASEEEPVKYPESTRYQGAIFKCHVGIKGRSAVPARLPVSGDDGFYTY